MPPCMFEISKPWGFWQLHRGSNSIQKLKGRFSWGAIAFAKFQLKVISLYWTFVATQHSNLKIIFHMFKSEVFLIVVVHKHWLDYKNASFFLEIHCRILWQHIKLIIQEVLLNFSGIILEGEVGPREKWSPYDCFTSPYLAEREKSIYTESIREFHLNLLLFSILAKKS